MQTGETFEEIVQGCERPILFLAHPGDEVCCSGLLQRLHQRIRVVFMTNGDGPSRTGEEDPAGYAARRKEEAIQSLRKAGVDDCRVRFLGHSEIEIHRNLAKLKWAPLRLSEVAAFFEPVRESMAEAVYEFRPEVAFTVAYQGGDPEHDLTHFFASLALRAYGRDGDAAVSLYQFPVYELASLLPVSLRPWRPNEEHWIDLTPEELEVKQAMARCSGSLISQIRRFRIAVGALTLPRRILRRSPSPIRQFFAREQVSRVPADFDYQKPPCRFDFLNYLFENFQGTPVTFQDCIRPLLLSFEDRMTSPADPN